MANRAKENKPTGLDPDGLHSQHLSDKVKEIPVQSYKILNQCFHPDQYQQKLPSKDGQIVQNINSDFILIFEEQINGSIDKHQIAQSQELQEAATQISNQILLQKATVPPLFKQRSVNSSVKTGSNASLQALNYDIPQINFSIQNTDTEEVKLEDDLIFDGLETFVIQKQLEERTIKSQSFFQYSDEDFIFEEYHNKGYISGEQNLQPTEQKKSTPQAQLVQNNDKYSTYKISIQRVTSKVNNDAEGTSVVIQANRFHIAQKYLARPLQNKMFFSQDGKMIFIVFTQGSEKKFWKILLFDSLTLKRNLTNEFDIRIQVKNIGSIYQKTGLRYKFKTNGNNIIGSPQIVLENASKKYVLQYPQLTNTYRYLHNKDDFSIETLFCKQNTENNNQYGRVNSKFTIENKKISIQIHDDEEKKTEEIYKTTTNYEIKQLVFGYEDNLILITLNDINELVCFYISIQSFNNCIHKGKIILPESMHMSTLTKKNEIPAIFNIKSAFIRKVKDQNGSWLHIALDTQSGPYLIYIKQTHLTQTIIATATIIKNLKELIVPQNPELWQDLSFIIKLKKSEEYHFISSNELLENQAEINEIIKKKTFKLNEGEHDNSLESSNFIDFNNKSTQQSRNYYSYINLKPIKQNSPLQTTQMTRIIKTKDNYEQQLIQYISSIELINKSLKVKDEIKPYSRHQLFIFLAKEQNDSKEYSVNCLILPSYIELSGSPDEFKVKLIKLPFELLDSNKYIETKSDVQMELCPESMRHKDKILILKKQKFFVLCFDNKNNQIGPLSICILKLKEKNLLDTNISDNNAQLEHISQVLDLSEAVGFKNTIIGMKTTGEFLLLLTKTLFVLKYKYDAFTKKLVFLKEWSMTKDALIQFQKNICYMCQCQSSQQKEKEKITCTHCFQFTEKALYTQSNFYMYMSQKRQLEQYKEFEEKRCMKSFIKEAKKICLGPLISTDKSNILYLQYYSPSQKNKLSQVINISNQQFLKIIIMPLHYIKEFNLVHQDDFIDKVKLTSFIGKGDILVQLWDTNVILIFTSLGILLPIKSPEKQLANFDKLMLHQIQTITNSVSNEIKMNRQTDTVLNHLKVHPQDQKISDDNLTKTRLLYKSKDDQLFIQVLTKCEEKEEYELQNMEIIEFNKMKIIGKKQYCFKIEKAMLDNQGKPYIHLIDYNEEEKTESIKQTHYFSFFNENNYKQEKFIIQKETHGKYQSGRFDFLILNNDKQQDSKTFNDKYFIFKDQLKFEIHKFNDEEIKLQPNVKIIDMWNTLVGSHLDPKPEVQQNKSNDFITQMLPTEHPNIIQFIYFSNFISEEKKQHLITWDIEKDIEVNFLTLDDQDNNKFVWLWRGISERQNYFIPQENDYYYDLRYKFPKNFMSGKRAGNYHIDFPQKFKTEVVESKKSIKSVMEYKLGINEEAMLGIGQSKLLTLQFANQYLQREYAEYLIKIIKDLESSGEQKACQQPIMKLLIGNFGNEENILHKLATKEQFLNYFLQQIKRLMKSSKGKQYALYFIYYVLFSNCTPKLDEQGIAKGRRPLTIALKEQQPKCLEIMLMQLQLDQSQDYMIYVKEYIIQLLELKSVVFSKFLVVSCHKEIERKNTFNYPTKFNRSNTNYFIKEEELIDLEKQRQQQIDICLQKQDDGKKIRNEANKNLKGKDSGSEKYKIDHQRSELSDEEPKRYKQNDLSFKKPKNLEKFLDPNYVLDSKTFVYSYYDFGEIITNQDKRTNLLCFISEQESYSDVLANKTILAFLDSQWCFLYNRFYFIALLYFISFLLSTCYSFIVIRMIRDKSDQFDPFPVPLFEINIFPFINKIEINKYFFFALFFIFQFGISSYLTIFETRRFYKTQQLPKILFLAIYNAAQLISMLFDIFLILVKFLNYFYNSDPQPQRNEFNVWDKKLDSWDPIFIGIYSIMTVFGFVAFLMKIMQLNIAKLYLRRIYMVIIDVWVLLSWSIAVQVIFTLAYTMIFQINTVEQAAYIKQRTFTIGDLYNSEKYFSENPFTQLDEIANDWPRDEISYQWVVYYLLLSVLTIAIVCINAYFALFMIAAVVKSFSKVSKDLSKQKYLARAQILYENTVIFDPNSPFENCRYIVKKEAITGQGDEKKDKEAKRENSLADLISNRVKQEQIQQSQASELNFKKTIRENFDQLYVSQKGQDNSQVEIKKILEIMQTTLKSIEEVQNISIKPLKVDNEKNITALKRGSIRAT